jgi:putative NIF3 family GTP cyclohydrolase 1 type 2
MKVLDIAKRLDSFFNIDAFPPDQPFSVLVPEIYGAANIEVERYLEKKFLSGFHGLMMSNGQAVERIFITVFLSDEIVSKILDTGDTDVLIISHHPLFMETGNRGFLPLSPVYLDEMKRRCVSVYSLHTPLDVHGEVSTSRALARELGLADVRPCYPVSGGQAGIYGKLPASIGFNGFLHRITDVTDVKNIHSIKKHDMCENIGVLAGGCDVDGIREMTSLGCDTFVTGTYHNQVQTEIGQRYRDAFALYRDRLSINIIECSHYASEAVVMRMDIFSMCSNWNVECEYLEQDNPWE